MRYVHHLAAAAMIVYGACVLAGCSSTASAPSPAEILYAAAATLDQTEVAATIYVKSPIADKAVVTEIKSLDNTAYTALHPLVDQVAAGTSVLTASQADMAQAAVAALGDYLTSHGVK
jgi:hypothetical protein